MAERLVAELPAAPAPVAIALYGELGSGKTCFVQGLARGMGIARPVTSPTFILINEYRHDRPLVHIDLYRLGGPDQVLAIGFEDYLDANAVTVVEWAERAGDLIPDRAIRVYFETGADPEQRTVTIRSSQER